MVHQFLFFTVGAFIALSLYGCPKEQPTETSTQKPAPVEKKAPRPAGVISYYRMDDP